MIGVRYVIEAQPGLYLDEDNLYTTRLDAARQFIHEGYAEYDCKRYTLSGVVVKVNVTVTRA